MSKNYKKWTLEEVEKLEKYYSKGDFAKFFPDRTMFSIYGKANLLGLMGKTNKGFCRICDIKLLNKIWFKSSQRKKDYICKSCLVKDNRRRRIPERTKKYNEENVLHTNGRSYIVKKRSKPLDKKCELCRKEIKLLVYHHYGEIKIKEKLIGIWICLSCHQFIERYEKGFLPKYKELKKRVYNESAIN